MRKTMFALATMAAAVCAAADVTLDHARKEAERLMGRVGVTRPVTVTEGAGRFVLRVGAADEPRLDAVRHDGFACNVTEDGVTIAAPTAKGVLNGVYTLAEEAGFAFVYPGATGELSPEKPQPLAKGARTVNPRFAYRGFFDVSEKCGRYTMEEWIDYLTKLRFNAMNDHGSGCDRYCEQFKRMGFRVETGGHGLSSCLPRDLYRTQPELFRMFQPEDFGGKRQRDSNLCVSNPETQAIVASNYVARCRPFAAQGYHAVHAWADDLPGGGWCMCSRCRSMTASDQSQMAMNLEARALRKAGIDMRVPAISYHDTLFPSAVIRPDPKCFFLFAPRERCYGHALNDASCALNSEYMAALRAWDRCYAGIGDGHTFEYYTDTMLCRGHAVYLPDVLIGDADAYSRNGVEAWLTVHIGGPQLAIEWNLLAMARVAWEGGHDRDSLTRSFARAFPASERDVWQRYLTMRAQAYETALRVCKVSRSLYFDYRFMPELGGADGRQLVADLLAGGEGVRAAQDYLKSECGRMTGASRHFAELEVVRGVHEVTDLRAMAEHQKGLYEIAEWRSDNDNRRLDRACAHFEKTISLLRQACDEMRPIALKPGQKDSDGGFGVCYYLNFASNWLIPEVQRKIENYRRKGL